MSTLRTIAALVCMLAWFTPSSVISQQTMSRRDLHKLIARAKSPEDFAKLELYYQSQAEHYGTLAHQEQQEMRRSQDAIPWEKSPRRSESAKQLCEYYQQIATRDTELATRYKQRLPPSQ